MKNTNRRRRRGNPSRNGKRTSKRAIQTLATSAVIAAGTQAYGSPIRFDNPAHGEPGHFHWAEPVGQNTLWLDVMQDADAQPGTPYGESTLHHFYSSSAGTVRNSSSSAMRLQTVNTYFLAGVDSGDMIPSGMSWRHEGHTYYVGYGSWLPEGTPTYLGVRFNVGAGVQYGWVGVTRDGMQLETFAWGYETEPNTPVPAGAPEPGTLAMLACGAVAVLRRRR